MSQSQIRGAIRKFINAQGGTATAVDVLRSIEVEAMLMREQEELVDILRQDPFEEFADVRSKIAHLTQTLKVTSCRRERAGNDYARIHATVNFECGVQLTFHYKRRWDTNADGSRHYHVWYSIESSHEYGPKQNVLVAQVWSQNSTPNMAVPAVSMADAAEEGNDDDGANTSDKDDDAEHANKRARLAKEGGNDSTASSTQGETASTTKTVSADMKAFADRDRYMGFMDPEVLDETLTTLGLQPMNEATAFFLLMTFPFYEHEWDLVGFVLNDVFGVADGGSDDENGDGGMKEGADDDDWSDVSES